MCLSLFLEEILIQYLRIKNILEVLYKTLLKIIGNPTKESSRQFTNEEWNFPKGLPFLSQNFLKFGNQWHAIDPADPVDSIERIPFKPTEKPSGEILMAYKVMEPYIRNSFIRFLTQSRCIAFFSEGSSLLQGYGLLKNRFKNLLSRHMCKVQTR